MYFKLIIILDTYEVAVIASFVDTHAPLSPNTGKQYGTGQRAVTLFGWEGNRGPSGK